MATVSLPLLAGLTEGPPLEAGDREGRAHGDVQPHGLMLPPTDASHPHGKPHHSHDHPPLLQQLTCNPGSPQTCRALTMPSWSPGWGRGSHPAWLPGHCQPHPGIQVLESRLSLSIWESHCPSLCCSLLQGLGVGGWRWGAALPRYTEQGCLWVAEATGQALAQPLAHAFSHFFPDPDT